MNFSKIAVNRPTTVVIIFLLLLGLGFYAALDLPLDLFPELNPPVLLLFTQYPGTGPEEMEKTISRPLESALSNVGNIDKITSTSSEGDSQIIIEFKWGTNMSEAANEVRDKLEFVKQYLPDEAESPMIFKFDPSMMPIVYMSLGGKRSPEELRQLAEKIVQPRLEQVEGVSMVSITGGRERTIRVEIPQNRLEAHNLTLTRVSQMLMGQNIQISAGSITEGNKNYLIRTSGEYKDIEEIRNTVIAYKGGNPMSPMGNNNATPILLRDIANIYDGLKKEEDVAYVNGEPAVQLAIQKQSGVNSVQTADNIHDRLDKIRRELPSNVTLNMVYDQTKIIRSSLQQVTNTGLTGIILAVLILFIFLRSLKSVIIIFISIPVSVILTLMMMYFSGFTLNIMTLMGLALGIGMLVDNSIVILENIYRYREKGTKLTSAAILGSQEMTTAIIASTLTTICVFAPVAMFKSQLGMFGELFNGLAFTVVFSLASSLVVAIVLVPVLSSKYLPLSTRLEQNLSGPFKAIDDAMERFFLGLDNAYRKALAVVLRKRKTTVFTIIAIFIFSIILSTRAGFQLMPKADQDAVQLAIELPEGTKLEVTKNILMQIEHLINTEIKGYKDIIVQAGEKSFHGYLGSSLSNKGVIFIILEDDINLQVETSTEIQAKLRKHFHDFPSVIFEFREGMQMGGGGSPIDILVKSNDLMRARDEAKKILQLIKDNVPEVTEPAITLKEGLPQVEIVIDRDKAYSLGLNIMTIGQEVKANIDGVRASKYKEGGNEYDILVILDPKDRDAIPDLQKIFVVNSSGQKVPLANFAHIERTTGPVNIDREDQMRTIHVTGDIEKVIEENGKKKRVKLNEVEMKIRKLIKREIPQDDNLIIDFSGDYADMMEYTKKLFYILLISIALIFGVMASQFESFLDPFIIVFTVPLTFIGVSWFYVLSGEQFNIFTVVGIVILGGIVVNNSIVLVDYTNMLVRRGKDIIEACIEAGGNRLRPILMTTLTTVLGVLPMALVKVDGAEMSRPMAKTIVGGLTISTIFTLFLIPVIYSKFNQMAQKNTEKRELKRQERLEIRKEKLKKMREGEV